jgi:galactokinase
MNQSRIIAIDLNDEFEINLADSVKLTDNVDKLYKRLSIN